jgi:hypothetical protein
MFIKELKIKTMKPAENSLTKLASSRDKSNLLSNIKEQLP